MQDLDIMSFDEKKEIVLRLINAFKELRKKWKIWIRVDFWCCQTCANADILDRLEKLIEQGYIGFMYWHRQDQENLEESGCVYVSYGHLDDNRITTKEVGNIIVSVLRKHGVEVEWNGNPDTRILIKNIPLGYLFRSSNYKKGRDPTRIKL